VNEESEIEIDIEENNTSDVIDIESVIDENKSDDDDAEDEAEEEEEVNNQETDTQNNDDENLISISTYQ
jgi:hypothetical protein